MSINISCIALSDKNDQFSQIVGQLRQLIDDAVMNEAQRLQALSEAAAALMPADISELIVGARRFRYKHLKERLFGEPAWDIMLQLHVAHYRQQAISVSSAVTFGNTAPTTGLRWLRVLESEGLIERHGDPDDQRRSFVGLTPDGIEKMDRYVGDYSKWVATKAQLRRL